MEKIFATHGFKPAIDKDSEILILGSFPSVLSRRDAFFYMHPKNRFWQILATIYQDDFLNPDISVRKKLLKKHHLALYDVIEACSITGSADSSIEAVVPADIGSLVKGTRIEKILINGQKAWDLFQKYDRELMDIAYCLPSTSPANARFSLDKLITIWQDALTGRE